LNLSQSLSSGSRNILRQANESKKNIAATLEPSALKEDAEKELARQIPQTAKTVEILRKQKNYEQALLEVSKLRPAVDKFFDKVMVMVDDEKVRANRLMLLQTLLKEFSTIADFSEIVTEGSKESPKQ
jgi:glycyl-tRNA synthetase beta chain